MTLLSLSLIAAILNVIAFYGGSGLWSWESPLKFPLAIVLTSLALFSNRWWSYLLAVLLTPYVFYNLSSEMFLEWREYWSVGAGFEVSLRQALFPIWEPLTAIVAFVVFCYAAFYLLRYILDRHVALP